MNRAVDFKAMIYFKPRFSVIALFLFILVLVSPSFAQESVPPKPSAESTAKSEVVINHAIEVLGGGNYLNVKTAVGRGFFTAYQGGMSQLPARFVDYISYPDHERTEFTSLGIRVIQTNAGDTGWLFDGATKALSDMKAPQIADFKRSMRTSVENLLHGWWRKEGATLNYIGKREAGVGKRNETVRLSYPDGFWIEYEFGARDGLPAKVIYKRTRQKADSDETEEISEEDRLAKFITIQGVTAAWVVDHYINGVQTSRIGFESLVYNQPLADSLFAKPASVKAIK